eukprot:scaffold1692_cov74-Skeletonema_menzelii.AAC.11
MVDESHACGSGRFGRDVLEERKEEERSTDLVGIKDTQGHSRIVKDTQGHSGTLKDSQGHSGTLRDTQGHSGTVVLERHHEYRFHALDFENEAFSPSRAQHAHSTL